MTRTSRTGFESAALELLARKGPQSRADLARAVGITRPTAGNLVARLLEEGIVEQLGASGGPDRPVGRPGERLALNPRYTHVVGVDAGIGFVLALRMDLAGEVHAVERIDVSPNDDTPETLAAHIVRLVASVCRDAPPIAGVSIAIPGIITRGGHVMRAPYLGWTDVPFLALIEKDLAAFGTLALENDANALAMGELIRGNVSSQGTTIFFSMDVGVGGSIIWNGKLMDGQSGLAGEFGHIFVRPSAAARPLRLEELIGRHAVLQRYGELRAGPAGDLDRFLAALDSGDEAAKTVQQEWVEAAAQALATITSVINPGSIVFGGSMTGLLTRSREDLEAAYAALLMHGTVKPRFVVAQSAEHSVARGCADLRRASVFRP